MSMYTFGTSSKGIGSLLTDEDLLLQLAAFV